MVAALALMLALTPLSPRQTVAAQERPSLPIKARTKLGVQLFLILLVSSLFLL
jgi:hypothetical protein